MAVLLPWHLTVPSITITAQVAVAVTLQILHKMAKLRFVDTKVIVEAPSILTLTTWKSFWRATTIKRFVELCNLRFSSRSTSCQRPKIHIVYVHHNVVNFIMSFVWRSKKAERFIKYFLRFYNGLLFLASLISVFQWFNRHAM